MSVFEVSDELKDEVEFQNEMILDILLKHKVPIELWNIYSIKLLNYLADLVPFAFVISEDKEAALCASTVLHDLKPVFEDFEIRFSELENGKANS